MAACSSTIERNTPRLRRRRVRVEKNVSTAFSHEPDLDEAAVTRHLQGREIDIEVLVGRGPGRATVRTCDLTHDYISINADYRS